MTPRQSFSSHPRIRDAAALGFTSSLGPFAANGIMPGFHAMAEDFGVSFVAVQQSLTIYLFTYAFFSLVAGSFSDSYGRRPTFIGGMLLFAAASIGAAFSQSLWALYGWRLLQGIGAAVGQVVTQAIVRDNWSGPEAANVNGMIAFFFAAGPALAPVVGGQIVMLFGWHAVFLFLLVYSLSIAAFIYYRIPETLHATDRSPFNLSAVCGNYAKGLTHGAFMTGVIAHGILFMGGILYSAGSADFVIKVMGLDVDEFGWLSIPLIFASFAGAWGSIRLAKRLRPKRMIIIVSVLTLAGSVLAALFDYIAEPGFLLLLIAPVLYSLGMALLRPVMMAMNLDYFPKNRGMAAAIQQFFVTASFCFSAAVWVPIVMGAAWKYALASPSAPSWCWLFGSSPCVCAPKRSNARAFPKQCAEPLARNFAFSSFFLPIRRLFSRRLPQACTTLALMQKTADINTVFFETQADTEAFARRIANALMAHESDIEQNGFNFRLNGGLGAGKTTLTRALLRACGVSGRVRSPTFELVEDYEIGATLAFHHFDFYRFESAEEFDEAGFRELFGPGMVTACEWSEKAAPYLPQADLEISLRVQNLSREATLKAFTPLGRTILAEVCA